MKYTLLKYKTLKLLVDENSDAQSILHNINSIEKLADDVANFYSNLLEASDKDAKELERKKSTLASKIGYKIIGVPFSNHDAELYALDMKLEYSELILVPSKN